MTRMVSQILWEHCMGELGIDGNNYENDTFAVRSYDWVDEDKNEWHFWHKPSGLKVEWYKYPLRGFEVNMDITDDQFLDVLRDCTNSMEDGKAVRFLHDIRRWWADRKAENSSEKPNNCDTCKHNKLEWYSEVCDSCCGNNNHYEPKDEPQRDCFLCKWLGEVNVCGRCRNRNLFAKADTEPKPKDEPTISKMEQVDKDINVRSKDEPQTERSE